MRMDEDQSHMTEKILDLTLEIIYLLTGEDCSLVLKRSHRFSSRLKEKQEFISEVPPHYLNPNKSKKKEILEATKKMIELLTGEVPIRCQDVTVYLSMEEWEYLEGHKDLYKDAMMASQPALTSPDRSSNGNPPERYPDPLYYHRDSTQEDLNIPHHHQGEDLIKAKVEVKAEGEETMGSGDQPSMEEEEEMTMKSKQEETSLHISRADGCHGSNNLDSKSEDNGLGQTSKAVNDNIPYGRCHTERSRKLSSPGNSSDQSHTMTSNIHQSSHSAERSTDPPNPKELTHKGVHTDEMSLSCLGCGESFKIKSELLLHLRTHTSVSFACLECGKSYSTKKELDIHRKCHRKQNSFPCSECGKCFTTKAVLVTHQRKHTGERPFVCPECGKCFNYKGSLLSHQRTHTKEFTFSCADCGKSFSSKAYLLTHQRTHTGERPFSCKDCGKSFSYSGSLFQHQKIHKGERPYSCSECGKCFMHKGYLLRHQSRH